MTAGAVDHAMLTVIGAAREVEDAPRGRGEPDARSCAGVRPTLNAFTVDVESFVESNVESFPIPVALLTERQQRYEVERNLDALLGLLDEYATHATFFFVGTIAERSPHLVQRVAGAGHEIGSHNYEHVRVFNQDPDTFRRKMADTKSRLEQLAGAPVVGFRAPDFSIIKSSLWALDVLKELGFVYDSSMFPIGFHDVYGVADADPGIHKLPNGLVEFPLSTASFRGRRLPFGGGGYFRLYPLRATRAFMQGRNRAGQPCMFYIHPYEVGPEIARVPLPPYRRFRHYYHTGEGGKRVAWVLRRFAFGTARQVLEESGVL